MAGVPFHSYEPYLAKLIRAGYKVGICEQTETPDEAKKRGAKLVNRDVIRIVTQGTLTEENLLEARDNNYLAAVVEIGGQMGMAWLELSTGEFLVQPVKVDQLGAALERIQAREILVPSSFTEKTEIYHHLALVQDLLTLQPPSLFDSQNAQKRLETVFGVGTLDSFGGFSRAEVAAAGALIDYIERTQIGRMPYLERPRQLACGAIMEIDAATRRNLELTRTLSGEKRGSLLSCIDRTVSAAGARLLQSRLAAPLTDEIRIKERLTQTAFFTEEPQGRKNLRILLAETPDMERALGRLSVGRGGPRDLGALRSGLKQAEEIGMQLANIAPLAAFAKDLRQSSDIQTLADELAASLKDELPVLEREGGFIRAGYHQQLDNLRLMRDESRRLIASLQGKYKETTGIETLKISSNNVLGFFIEVPSRRADGLIVRKNENQPADNPFIHRQTTASAVRFTTPELAELERDIGQAAERALAIEQELFAQMVTHVNRHSEAIGKIARALAALDVAAALAELAVDQNYRCPVIDSSVAFDIQGGRHPVVEQALTKQSGNKFVPNDCNLNETQNLWLLTGPNMAGKSTFLRQNALITILAQMGSFVPAVSAHIGIVDRLFSRVGAADDLASGRSTFMVEMVETATILNMETEKSLVILDEIGRGTATFDGLSIAWATVEHLHETNQCRALFATHYHELTSLQTTLPRLSCHSLAVKEWKGDIIFMHSVTEGSADRSYGIHVAKLAGLPPAVIARAKQVLERLQKSEQSGTLSRLADDLPLFSAAPQQKPEASALETRLAALNPDTLSPKEALEILYELKAL